MIEYSGIQQFQIYLEAAAGAQSEHGRKTNWMHPTESKMRPQI
jgi:hypothetical protein